MNAARFLIDTSALARLLRPDADRFGWDQAAAAGLLAVCPLTELEFLYSARNADDRARVAEDLRSVFAWVPVGDRVYDRASQVQEALTRRGQHRSAGAIDLLVAATAELQGLTLLHRDHDFDCIAAVTGQATQWYGPAGGA
ncbi:PIN domain-containing protein [Saccharomonospora azurea]|uniref:Ribonuclease VapC n=1 Tax=Saccharomonospora azurea NA-128 TaxID=882081 RepID=H8GF71_9PSEU|nr:PIN domain nuclease [Saccharomonospora azurea]EHK85209.1 PilT protein domain-containing protein [Saccharomonospora azurea SZMC 14600]EHY88015.1 putative nucleic acid-binding protein [Saccharomonospora azurea NA-128]